MEYFAKVMEYFSKLVGRFWELHEFLFLLMFFALLLPFQEQLVVDARGPLLAVMADEDEGLFGTGTEGFDEAEDEATAAVVEAVQGLVEDEQVGVLDEGTGYEHQTLFAT